MKLRSFLVRNIFASNPLLRSTPSQWRAVPADGSSHFGIPWTRVMTQMARRLSWVDPAFQLQVCT